MEHKILSEHACSVDEHGSPRRPSRAHKPTREAAFALTKKAFWVIILLSSLGVWATVWTAAASMASAWLQ
jgi:hypothetical protein